MQVKRLIEILKECNQEAVVIVNGSEVTCVTDNKKEKSVGLFTFDDGYIKDIYTP